MVAKHIHFVIKTSDGLKIKYQACNDENREYMVQEIKSRNDFEVIVFSPEWENYFFKHYKELSRQLCFIF